MSTTKTPAIQGARLLQLAGNQSHVWMADLSALPLDVECDAVLSVDERERAAHFRLAVHRRRSAAARGVLRMLLGRYLDLRPAAIVFTYGPKGKPQVAGSRVNFNISHAEDLCLFAFALSPIGVDVERVRQMVDCVETADRFFSVDEARRLRLMDPKDRDAAFFRCWTRKEAVVKALGVGLSFGLDRFCVSFDEPARVLRWDDDAGQAAKWNLFHLEPGPGHIGALAASGPCDAPLVFSLNNHL